MRHSLLCLLSLPAFFLPLRLEAQAPTGVRAGAGSRSAGGATLVADPSERLVGIPVGVNAAALAASVGAVSESSFGPGTVPLSLNGPGQVARFRWTDPSAARAGASLLLQAGALFAELNVAASPPESGGCGPFGLVTPQQCTAAFYDGSPTQGEYEQQASLAAIALNQGFTPWPGRTTIVAVIDTGIDPLHPSLAPGLAGPGFDFVLDATGGYDVANGIDDDRDGAVDEAFGHGTHVAGLIRLVDPSARILPYRVLDSDGNGTAYDVAHAIYLAAQEGAHVINLSIGLAWPSAAVEEALESLDDDGPLAIASAGNGARLGVGFLAALEETIGVAAVDDAGVLAPFASYGPGVDLVAPGVALYSAMPDDQYAWWSGSSMSAALVSGAVARLRSSSSGVDAEDASEALIDSALSVDSQNPGKQGLLGSGLIQVAQAEQLLMND